MRFGFSRDALVAMSGIYSKIMGSGLFYEKPTALKGVGNPEDCQEIQSDEELIQAVMIGCRCSENCYFKITHFVSCHFCYK